MENTKGRLAQVASSGGWEFRREGQTNTPLPSWLLSSFERSVVEPIRQTHLTFATTTPCHLILRQAKLGPRPRGLALLTVAFKHNDTEDLLGDPFLVNFAEDPQAAQSRFASWLNPAIAEAIERWRRLNF